MIAYKSHGQMLVTMSTGQQRPDSKIKDEDLWVFDGIAPWGYDNMAPNRMYSILRENTMAMPTIERKAEIRYGKGISYDAPANKLAEIKNFFKNNRIPKWAHAQITEYMIFGQNFSELILNKDKSKIVRISHKSCVNTRLTAQNAKTLLSEYVKYGNFEYFGTQNAITIPKINNEDPVSYLQDDLTGFKAFYHNYQETPGMIYYADSKLHGLCRDRGWLEVSNQIPEIIASINKNQSQIKYHLEIPLDYFNHFYKEWDSFDYSLKQQKLSEKLEEFNRFLTGTKNAGKTFASTYGVSPVNGSTISGFKITPLADYTVKDAYIPNSEMADSQIAYAIGFDPSEIGLRAASNTMGAGSGSNKRVSRTNLITASTLFIDSILEPLRVISEYNNWDAEFFITYDIPVTTDINQSGVQEL